MKFSPYSLLLIMVAGGLCWPLVHVAQSITWEPWYGWTQGTVTTAEVTRGKTVTGDGKGLPVEMTELQSVTINGKKFPAFTATIICTYEVSGTSYRLTVTDPQEVHVTEGMAGIHLTRLPLGTRVPIFYDRQAPAHGKAIRTCNLTYWIIPVLLTIAVAWATLRELAHPIPERGLASLRGLLGGVPALLACAYFFGFRVLDGRPADVSTSGKWDSAPELLIIWLLFSAIFSLVVCAARGLVKPSGTQTGEK